MLSTTIITETISQNNLRVLKESYKQYLFSKFHSSGKKWRICWK